MRAWAAVLLMFEGVDIEMWKTRTRQAARYYLQGLYGEIAGKNLFLWAQAIAFKVLVTIVPIVLLATGIAGRLLRGNDAFAAVVRFIHDFLPPRHADQLVSFLEQLQQASTAIVGVGGVGLFLSAVSLFITLRIAVSNAFEQDWHEGRSILGGYLFDVRMVIQVGLFFILTIGISVTTQSILSPPILKSLGANAQWVLDGWQRTIRLVSLSVPFLLTTAMFFQLYYFVPKPHPQKRSALIGAAIAGALWEAMKQAFTYYATYVGQFDRFGDVLGNTFGLIIAFVFWVYFSGIVLMVGAVIASLREHRYVAQGRLPGEGPPDEELPADEAPATAPGPASTRDTVGDGAPGTNNSSDSTPEPSPNPPYPPDTRN
jgi:membrane protein